MLSARSSGSEDIKTRLKDEAIEIPQSRFLTRDDPRDRRVEGAPGGGVVPVLEEQSSEPLQDNAVVFSQIDDEFPRKFGLSLA